MIEGGVFQPIDSIGLYHAFELAKSDLEHDSIPDEETLSFIVLHLSGSWHAPLQLAEMAVQLYREAVA